jgi:hypothetical protein
LSLIFLIMEISNEIIKIKIFYTNRTKLIDNRRNFLLNFNFKNQNKFYEEKV